MTAREIINKLNLRLELFTCGIIIPNAVYFSVVAGGFKETTDIITAVFWSGVFTVLTVGWALGWRILRVRYIFGMLDGSTRGLINPAGAVRKLLYYPFFEANLILARWTIGATGVHVAFFFTRGKVAPGAFLSLPCLFLQILPLSYIIYFFMTENVLRGVLQSEKLKHIDLPTAPSLGYFRRILLSIFAVTVMPFTMTSYLLYVSQNGVIQISNPLLHIVIMLFLTASAVGVTTYVVAKAVKKGLSETNSTLENLGKGVFDYTAVRSSADEFGDQSYMLSRVTERLKRMYDEIKSLNESLEHRVQVRTHELNRTLEKLQELKTQQDGDYFLTSLLLKPLSTNQVNSSTVNVEFLIRQKKRFEFRRWKEEIGGDICVARTIQLRGRDFTVFLNGDAMGKSIQGAGGALVLGSVFASILERTRLTSALRENYPERWLKNAFIELQKVFVSFEGTMLVSLVMGLIDDSTGTLYYINAEHPPVVLYRHGKAMFLDRFMFHKLGTTGLDGSISVKTFCLMPDDVILAGSDGRDDIAIEAESNESGRIINEDENLFLRAVEETGSILSELEANLKQHGELTDDLSVLRIGFREDQPYDADEKRDIFISESILNAKKQWASGEKQKGLELLEKAEAVDGRHPEVLRLMVKMAMRIPDYDMASRLSEKYLERYPFDSRMLLIASFCFKKAKRYGDAVDTGERLRLREPDNLENLVLLAEVYFRINDFRRAEVLLEEAIARNPGFTRALRLRDKLRVLK